MLPTWKIDCAVVVRVHLIDHVLKLRFAGILAKRAHHSAEFFRGNLSCILLRICVPQNQGMRKGEVYWRPRLMTHMKSEIN